MVMTTTLLGGGDGDVGRWWISINTPNISIVGRATKVSDENIAALKEISDLTEVDEVVVTVLDVLDVRRIHREAVQKTVCRMDLAIDSMDDVGVVKGVGRKELLGGWASGHIVELLVHSKADGESVLLGGEQSSHIFRNECIEESIVGQGGKQMRESLLVAGRENGGALMFGFGGLVMLGLMGFLDSQFVCRMVSTDHRMAHHVSDTVMVPMMDIILQVSLSLGL